MNEIDTSMIDQYVDARLVALDQESAGYGIVATIIRDMQGRDVVTASAEKSAQQAAFAAMKNDSGLEASLLLLAKFDPAPDSPHYAKYHETTQRVMTIRTSHAAILHLSLIRNMYWGGNHIVEYLREQPIPDNNDLEYLSRVQKMYVDFGPTEEFINWSHGVMNTLASRSNGLVSKLRGVREFDEYTKSLTSKTDTDTTIEHAIQMANICADSLSEFSDLFSDSEDTRRIVAVADAMMEYLTIQTSWQQVPGFAVRVGAFAYIHSRLRDIAESTAYSEDVLRQEQAANKEEAGGAAAVVLAAVIEEPAIELESYEAINELSSLLKASKDDIKSQLGETGKRLVQGDADPLIKLRSCPEIAQTFAKKLLLAIATNPNADYVMELLSRTATRNPELAADPAVKAAIEACRWLQGNIAALAHKKYTYRNHLEGQLVQAAGSRFAAFMQAKEKALAS